MSELQRSGHGQQSERTCESLDGFNSKSQRAGYTIAAILPHRRIRGAQRRSQRSGGRKPEKYARPANANLSANPVRASRAFNPQPQRRNVVAPRR